MNVLLEKHGAKHIYKVPEGLRELCADIAREVLRSQPRNIYCFVADYIEALFAARENAKVAMKVINNILLKSQAIVGILHRSGLSLEQIARAAPRIQKAFRAYSDAVDMQAAQVCEDATCDARSKVFLQNILLATGVPLEQAEKSAKIIQDAFRGHHERMLLDESQDIIQWQQTTERILKNAGASQAEASKAAIIIQATYRGYYIRRNLKMKTIPMHQQKGKRCKEKESEADVVEPKETIQAMAWLDMMYENSGVMPTRVNEAASIIQKAYKRYRQKKNNTPQMESNNPMVVDAILKNIHQKAFDEVMNRADIPAEFGNREDLTKAGEELQRTFKDLLTRARMVKEGQDEEEQDESPVKLYDGTYSNEVAEDQEEDREIEVEPGREEGTDTYVRD